MTRTVSCTSSTMSRRARRIHVRAIRRESRRDPFSSSPQESPPGITSQTATSSASKAWTTSSPVKLVFGGHTWKINLTQPRDTSVKLIFQVCPPKTNLSGGGWRGGGAAATAAATATAETLSLSFACGTRFSSFGLWRGLRRGLRLLSLLLLSLRLRRPFATATATATAPPAVAAGSAFSLWL